MYSNKKHIYISIDPGHGPAFPGRRGALLRGAGGPGGVARRGDQQT